MQKCVLSERIFSWFGVSSLPKASTSETAEMENHYDNPPMQYTSIFHGCKIVNFHMKKCDTFLIFVQNIDNSYFEGMVIQIYPPELQLNKANTSDTEAPFLDLHLSISNGFVSSKIYNKRDIFDFDIVNFPFLDDDVPRRTSFGVHISQLIRFARVCSHVDDFNTRNKCLTAKPLTQGNRYHKLR